MPEKRFFPGAGIHWTLADSQGTNCVPLHPVWPKASCTLTGTNLLVAALRATRILAANALIVVEDQHYLGVMMARTPSPPLRA